MADPEIVEGQQTCNIRRIFTEVGGEHTLPLPPDPLLLLRTEILYRNESFILNVCVHICHYYVNIDMPTGSNVKLTQLECEQLNTQQKPSAGH